MNNFNQNYFKRGLKYNIYNQKSTSKQKDEVPSLRTSSCLRPGCMPQATAKRPKACPGEPADP